MQFWREMAYRALPEFLLQDSNTEDAFEKTSPWATSDQDDPMNLIHREIKSRTYDFNPKLGRTILCFELDFRF